MQNGATPRLSPFRPSDLLEMADRENQNVDEAIRMARVIFEASTGFTARLNGRVIGCAGMFVQWKGVGHAWVVISSEMVSTMHYKKWFHGCVRNLLRHVCAANDLRRVEAVVRADSERNIRWVEALGFSRETPHPMKHYRPDGDYYLYSLIGD